MGVVVKTVRIANEKIAHEGAAERRAFNLDDIRRENERLARFAVEMRRAGAL